MMIIVIIIIIIIIIVIIIIIGQARTCCLLRSVWHIAYENKIKSFCLANISSSSSSSSSSYHLSRSGYLHRHLHIHSLFTLSIPSPPEIVQVLIPSYAMVVRFGPRQGGVCTQTKPPCVNITD
jgi:hypothetical protein